MKPSNMNSQKPKKEIYSTDNYKLTPSSDDLDMAETIRPGGLLLAALIRCAREQHLQLSEMAIELGVSYSYIIALRNGGRSVNQISDEFARSCSRFLGIPRLTCLMLAGKICPEDLFEQDHMLATEISRAMEYICGDLVWGHLVTPELRSSNEHSQFAVVRLYEAATGKILMSKSLQYEILGAEISKLRAMQAKRAEGVPSHSATKKRGNLN